LLPLSKIQFGFCDELFAAFSAAIVADGYFRVTAFVREMRRPLKVSLDIHVEFITTEFRSM
jgi:hypothetical protein